MYDEVKKSGDTSSGLAPAKILRKIAGTLNMSVESFYDPATLGRSRASALLVLIQDYLADADPEARAQFVVSVQRMAEDLDARG